MDGRQVLSNLWQKKQQNGLLKYKQRIRKTTGIPYAYCDCMHGLVFLFKFVAFLLTFSLRIGILSHFNCLSNRYVLWFAIKLLFTTPNEGNHWHLVSYILLFSESWDLKNSTSFFAIWNIWKYMAYCRLYVGYMTRNTRRDFFFIILIVAQRTTR